MPMAHNQPKQRNPKLLDMRPIKFRPAPKVAPPPADLAASPRREALRQHEAEVDHVTQPQLTARERVLEGYRILALRVKQAQRPSPSFRSQTQRDAVAKSAFVLRAQPTPQLTRRAALESERTDELRRKVLHEDPNQQPRPLSEYAAEARLSVVASENRTSPWAIKQSALWSRSKVQRGNYLYNWTAYPESVPKVHRDSLPGPGAYLDPLHFVGGSTVGVRG